MNFFKMTRTALFVTAAILIFTRAGLCQNSGTNTDSTWRRADLVRTGTTPADLRKQQMQSPDPDPDDFVELDKDPRPLVPINSLITYPEDARINQIEGKAVVRLLIDKTGKVTKSVLDSSSGDADIDAAALDAGRRATFSPAKRKGQPVNVWYR
jgi:TonB family protein